MILHMGLGVHEFQPVLVETVVNFTEDFQKGLFKNSISILIATVVVFISWKVFRFKMNVFRAKDWPGVRQPFSPNTVINIAGVLPSWICPYSGQSPFSYKWSNFYKKYGEDVLTCIDPENISFYVADADLAYEITTGRSSFFPKPTFFYKVLEVFGPNVVSTENETWKRHRKITSYGFSERNNKFVHNQSLHFASELVEELKLKCASSGVTVADVVPFTTRLALCIIASAAFGFQVDWKEDPAIESGYHMSFFSALTEIAARPLALILFPRWLMRIPVLNLPRLGAALDDFLKYIRERISNEKKISTDTADSLSNDLFSALIRASSAENERSLSISDAELIGNIYILMLAGHETTAHTLSFALALLALHEDTQQKFLEEIQHILMGKKEIAYEDLIRLKYGQAIMNETLRMFPIVTEIPKWAPHETFLGDRKIKIPAKSIVNIHVTGLHYNEKYWGSDAHIFRPERFLQEFNKKAFIPFSDGSRGCLGKRFAQIEIVSILAVLVQNFIITVPPASDKASLVDAAITLTLGPKGAINLQFTPRQAGK